MSLPSQEAFDRQMMSRALQLAQKGLFTCSPNPRVGCVICKDNQLLGEGWHEQAGEAHAEVNAMSKISADQLKGATVYVTLEPCAHTGKTGPCAQALVNADVARVVCAMKDPAPHVAGKGFSVLKQAGIKVESGLLETEAKALNPGFLKRMEQGMPYVRIKLATSLDGRTALANGESKWITSTAARKDVHYWRARSDVIVTGSGTVVADNPQMNARLEGEKVKQPMRVIIDSEKKVPSDALIFEEGETIKIGFDEESDWQIAATSNGKVNLELLLKKLADQEANEVWVEAGANLAGAFIEQKLVDELIVYIAPVLLGDKAQPLLVMRELQSMQEKFQLELIDYRMVGKDSRFRFQIV